MFILQISNSHAGSQIDVRIHPYQTVRLGRSSKAAISVQWDPAISREHADVGLDVDSLRVQCLPTARNPLVVNGVPAREATLQSGEEFRIGTTRFVFERVAHPDDPPVVRGGGSTSHIESSTTQAVHTAARPEVVHQQTASEKGATPPGLYRIQAGKSVVDFDAVDDSENREMLEQHTFAPGELSRFRFGKADERIEILADLPKLIAESATDEDLALSLAGLLLRAIPKSIAVAVAQFSLEELPDEDDVTTVFPRPRMLRIETRHGFDGTFRPSRRLIQRALKNNQSVLQIWHGTGGSANFTMSDGLGWAIVTPVGGQSSEGWCLYLSGAGSEGAVVVTPQSLSGDLRCAELIAQFLGSIRQVRLLEGQRTRMGSYFSPRILDSLTSTTSQKLTPTERDVAVLFCDVRNFSSMAEELKQELLTLLQSVSAALGTMTDGILDFDGTIADFQGDAALGFWGWPVENPEGPIPACHAALKILEGFKQPRGIHSELLAGFSIGMGIAYGPALAGEIGTSRQAKLGVFGPVVNAGARLQGLSKKFGVSICVDEATARYVRDNIPPKVAVTRKLGCVIPRGLHTPMNIYSLEPVEVYRPGTADDVVRQSYEFAIDAMQLGNWAEAKRILEGLPDTDGPTRFMLQYLQQHNWSPPSHWSGSINFDN